MNFSILKIGDRLLREPNYVAFLLFTFGNYKLCCSNIWVVVAFSSVTRGGNIGRAPASDVRNFNPS